MNRHALYLALILGERGLLTPSSTQLKLPLEWRPAGDGRVTGIEIRVLPGGCEAGTLVSWECAFGLKKRRRAKKTFPVGVPLSMREKLSQKKTLCPKEKPMLPKKKHCGKKTHCNQRGENCAPPQKKNCGQKKNCAQKNTTKNCDQRFRRAKCTIKPKKIETLRMGRLRPGGARGRSRWLSG